MQLFNQLGKLIGTFDHIQDAVNAADNSGETIRVKNGTYTEQVSVGAGKDGLSIIGESKAGVTIKAPAVARRHRHIGSFQRRCGSGKCDGHRVSPASPSRT